MKLRFGPATFSLFFCCIYALAFWNNLPLFLYYPLHGDLTWGPQVMKNAGPAMVWYGLMADAGIAAFLLALLVPDGITVRLFRNYLWLFPAAAMLICLYLLRHFFSQA